jgi:hypothetical protein
LQLQLQWLQLVCRQWPALCTCLFATLFSSLFVFYFAAIGWPGQVSLNCFEDFLQTPDCFCERMPPTKGAAWMIAQPVNTVTNLFFVLNGLLIAIATDTRRFPSEKWWNKNTNLMTRDKLYPIVFATNSCLLGVGSTFLHASFTAWGRQLDMIAMYMIAIFGVVYGLVRYDNLEKFSAICIYVASIFCLVLWTFHATVKETQAVFSSLLIVSWIIEILMIQQSSFENTSATRNPTKRVADVRLLLAMFGVFGFGMTVWMESKSGGPWCMPDSIFQGHALWHLLSSMAIGCMFLFYLSEQETFPKRKEERGDDEFPPLLKRAST